MAVKPRRYLVSPRFVATTLMLPLLTVFSTLMGVFGGYLLAVFLFNMSPNVYLEPIPQHVTTFDFNSGLFKAMVFGMEISAIACYKGINTRGGAAGVGRSTTNSVVITYSTILISNFLMTLAMNMVHVNLTSSL